MPQIFRDGTLGDKVRELPLSGIHLTEARFAPGQVLPWHAHERPSLGIVLEGANTVEFRSSAYQLAPFDAIFKPDGAEHCNRYRRSGGTRCLIVDMNHNWIDALEAKGRLLDIPSFFSSRALPETGRRLYREFIEPDDLTEITVEAICAELMVQATRSTRLTSTTQTPLWLRRVRELLHSHYHERLTLEQLARVAAVHPVHLAQTFRLVYSCTIGDYVRNLRVTRAASELASTNQPLAEIAIGCGFYDQSHFNRVFKKYVKTTPAEYRKRHHQKQQVSNSSHRASSAN